MSKRKTEVLYEKGTGAELFTSREAARFLDYHPVAFRNLVSKGKIRVHSRTGNYPLFLREELEKYQLTNKWAGRKAKVKPTAVPINKIRAVVTAAHGKREVIEELNDFKWADLPAIRARTIASRGRIHFQITVELPDGTGCSILFSPPAKKA